MNPELTDDETEDHRASESDLVEEGNSDLWFDLSAFWL